MMNTDILTIQSLTKGFTRRIKDLTGSDSNEQYWVIKDLFLNIPRGKIIALIGGNGAGKTTLFNMISGLVKPDTGSIGFSPDGKAIELLGMEPHRIAGKGVGRMFQDNHIFSEMSVLDNMLMGDLMNDSELPFRSILFRKLNKREEENRILKAKGVLERLFGGNSDFWEKRDDSAGTLSYGQQRLLGLARLFMRDYNLLLLDEPTSGVNPEVIEQIKLLIRKFTDSGQTVFLIEHNLDVVIDIADFCCYLDQGRIALMGTPEDIIGNEEVKKSYIGL